MKYNTSLYLRKMWISCILRKSIFLQSHFILLHFVPITNNIDVFEHRCQFAVLHSNHQRHTTYTHILCRCSARRRRCVTVLGNIKKLRDPSTRPSRNILSVCNRDNCHVTRAITICWQTVLRVWLSLCMCDIIVLKRHHDVTHPRSILLIGRFINVWERFNSLSTDDGRVHVHVHTRPDWIMSSPMNNHCWLLWWLPDL